MIPVRSLASIALLAAASTASAHVSFTGRDILANGTFDGIATWTLNSTVASNYGWADATDADWGDSHRGRFMKFTLTQTSDVTVLVKARSGVPSTMADLIPGFSLYSGTVPQLSHEGSSAPGFVANHPGFLASSPYHEESGGPVGDKEGAWRALNDFWMGNDAGEAAKATYIGHAVDGNGIDVSGDRVIDVAGDGTPDQMVSGTWRLGPGTYSIGVGGACYACQYTEDSNTWLSNRAFSASLTVVAVPEPETWALTGAGLVLLALARRRIRRA